ncbi:MAG: TraB/GumN family protein [Deltaproteobacteria bacterium]|nr:TraB/GumN family protein [Deltaproteobacteria bacterium]TLN04688.1 MAG: TraB/GumN family protein [bacterium]
MKKVFFSLMLVLFTCSWAAAETSVWKVQKGRSVLYLGGTCHILREADYPLPPEFDRAYKAADILVFETDLGKFQEPEIQRKMLARASYSDGTTVAEHLSPAAYEQLKAYCESNGIPLASLQGFKPSLLMVMLTMVEFMKMGVTQRGVDVFFHELAKKDKKAVEGLETVDEQIDYVASMADGIENEFVSFSLKEMNSIRQQFELLVHAWRVGDMEKLDTLLNHDLKSRLPMLHQRLMVDRNRNWLPRIDTYLKTPDKEFILVGAGHLAGAEGIIEALKKKGYVISKL